MSGAEASVLRGAPAGGRVDLPGAGDEAGLVARLREGDASAFERLVREHAPRMLAVASRLLGSEPDAQDAVQEAFLSAYRSVGRFEGGPPRATGPPRTPVTPPVITRGARGRGREVPIGELLPRFLADGHRELDAPLDRPSGPGASTPTELRQLVRDGIDCLDAPHREVLLLRDLEGLSTLQTASILGISQAAVKARAHRARQALRTLLGPVMAVPDREPG